VSAGVHSAFLLGSVVAIVALIAAVFVKEVALRGTGPKSEGSTQDAAVQPPVVEAV
jgi:hypothetical protein